MTESVRLTNENPPHYHLDTSLPLNLFQKDADRLPLDQTDPYSQKTEQLYATQNQVLACAHASCRRRFELVEACLLRKTNQTGF
ncbi:MAG: hypothetical protein RLY57_281 [Candidatus Parcubacteria bacterium]